MRFTTASLAMLAAVLLPMSSSAAMKMPSSGGEPRLIPVALSPTTEVTMTFDALRFDGAWNVVVFCPASESAPASALRFMAGVRNGVLHGERGSSGSRGSMTLEGTIQPDGLAHLQASGITNDADEVLGVSPRDRSFVYEVAARFQGERGLGARIDGRVCHLNFTRQ
jgi:hypothetical protein